MIQDDIIAVLLKYAEGEEVYINPNFLIEIEQALDSYYNLDNDKVHNWIQDMFGW